LKGFHLAKAQGYQFKTEHILNTIQRKPENEVFLHLNTLCRNIRTLKKLTITVYCNFCLFVIGPSGKVSRKSNLMDDDDLNDYENDDFFEDDENDETYSTSTDASTDVAEKKPMNQRKVRNVLF
jgi:hypothetical protein